MESCSKDRKSIPLSITMPADLLSKDTGLSAIADDMFTIDTIRFATFTSALADEYSTSKHPVYRLQLHSVLLIALVLLQRSGHNLDMSVDTDLIDQASALAQFMAE